MTLPDREGALVAGEGDVHEMPPFRAELAAVADYYRLAFLPDGFPGRRGDDGTVAAHPIYGVYVIDEYVKQYKLGPRPELARAIRTVVEAALSRMESFSGALVFWYPEGSGVSRQRARHYSGLTQAYYAVSLHRAAVALDEPEWIARAEACFRSLLVPEDAGGVYYEWEDGCAVAEVPTRPRDLILNGWLSILASVHQYHDLTNAPEAASLLQRSADTMARLLPLYDMPELRNSRYGLVGPVYARVRLGGKPDGVVIRRATIDVPKEGSFAAPVGTGTRFENWVNEADVRPLSGLAFSPLRTQFRLNLVTSRLGHPAANTLRLDISSPRPMPLRLELHLGRYDPLTTAPIERTWTQIDEVVLPRGDASVELTLRGNGIDLLAYPTSFTKKLDGHQVNVYHMIHIKRLRELHAWTGIDRFAEYAARWERYVFDWPQMPLYDGLHVRSYLRNQPSSMPPREWAALLASSQP
jgi:hypothetical protein